MDERFTEDSLCTLYSKELQYPMYNEIPMHSKIPAVALEMLNQKFLILHHVQCVLQENIHQNNEFCAKLTLYKFQ